MVLGILPHWDLGATTHRETILVSPASAVGLKNHILQAAMLEIEPLKIGTDFDVIVVTTMKMAATGAGGRIDGRRHPAEVVTVVTTTRCRGATPGTPSVHWRATPSIIEAVTTKSHEESLSH